MQAVIIVALIVIVVTLVYMHVQERKNNIEWQKNNKRRGKK